MQMRESAFKSNCTRLALEFFGTFCSRRLPPSVTTRPACPNIESDCLPHFPPRRYHSRRYFNRVVPAVNRSFGSVRLSSPAKKSEHPVNHGTRRAAGLVAVD
jgi:hypothetical protein